MKRKNQIEQMLQKIRSRGGVVHLSDSVPDDLAQLFLREILNCPDCIEEGKRVARVRRRTDH